MVFAYQALHPCSLLTLTFMFGLACLSLQAWLSRVVSSLRSGTAEETDERVRVTGEAVAGALAAKMLVWEGPLLERVRAIRRREAGHLRGMALIRAFNYGLSFATIQLVGGGNTVGWVGHGGAGWGGAVLCCAVVL